MIDRQPGTSKIFSLPAFAAFLALAIFACFPSVLIGSESFFFRDYGVLGYPVIHYFRESFSNGELPLWNPLSNSGVPFFAQWGTMGAYPLSLIYLLLPLPWSLSVFCFLHLWLAGIGMFLLARRWTGNDFAGAFAGTAFAFNGIVFASFIWPNYFVALGWMPFVVLLAERAWREGGRWIAGAALVSALQLGSGVPEMILFTWLIVATVWITDFGEAAGSGGRLFLRLVGVVALAGALMAVQLLPFFELLAHSQRDTEFATGKWSLPAWGWQNFLLPLVNCFESNGRYFQFGQEFMSSVYLGAAAITLAIFGMIKLPNGRLFALAALAALAVVLALGDHTPVLPLVRKAFPATGVARYPVKFLFVAAFVLPLLAAQGVRAVHVEGRRTRAFAYVTLFVLLFMGGFLWAAYTRQFIDYSAWPENFRVNTWMSWGDAARNAAVRAALLLGTAALLVWSARRDFIGAAAGVLALVLLVVDVCTHTPRQNPTLPSAEFTGTVWDSPAGERPRFGESRVFITRQAEDILLNVSSTNEARLWQAKRRALWSNLNLLESAPKVNGSATLQVREQAAFQKALYAATNSPPGILDFLGVRWITASNRVDEWIRRDTALPLVTGGQRVLFGDDAEMLRSVLRTNYNPREVVFLPLRAQANVTATNAARIRVDLRRAAAHAIEADIVAEEPGIVVVAQSYYPLWRATVDGREVPLLRANFAFQALEVPAGSHRVRLEYRDNYLRAGAGISAAALLLCALIGMRSRRPGR